MVSTCAGEGGVLHNGASTSFVNFVLAGEVLDAARPLFFGASLLVLKKIDGGVPPIANGSTFRRLIAKVGCRGVLDRVKEYLAPLQLGFGTKLGAEAAIHSVRTFYIPSLLIMCW